MTKPDKDSNEERDKRRCRVCGCNWAPVIDEKTGEVLEATIHPEDTICYRHKPMEIKDWVLAAAAKLDDSLAARSELRGTVTNEWTRANPLAVAGGARNGEAMLKGEGLKNG